MFHFHLFFSSSSSSSLQSSLFTSHTDGILRVATEKVPSIFKGTRANHTNKAISMPLRSKGFDNRIRNRFPAALALCTVPMRMTIDTPCVPVFLDKRRRAVKRITALSAEKVAGVPLCTTCYNDLAFNGRFAALASWREELVEVEVAVEPRRFISAIIVLQTSHVFGCRVRGQERNVVACETGADTLDTFGVLVGRLGVEGHTLEVLTTLIACEAFWMEARASCRDYTTCNG